MTFPIRASDLLAGHVAMHSSYPTVVERIDVLDGSLVRVFTDDGSHMVLHSSGVLNVAFPEPFVMVIS